MPPPSCRPLPSGCGLDVWKHTKENEAKIIEHIRTINRSRFGEEDVAERTRALSPPMAEREELKQGLRGQLQAESLAGLRDRAKRLYQSLVR